MSPRQLSGARGDDYPLRIAPHFSPRRAGLMRPDAGGVVTARIASEMNDTIAVMGRLERAFVAASPC
jgi:hypothetical protein